MCFCVCVWCVSNSTDRCVCVLIQSVLRWLHCFILWFHSWYLLCICDSPLVPFLHANSFYVLVFINASNCSRIYVCFFSLLFSLATRLRAQLFPLMDDEFSSILASSHSFLWHAHNNCSFIQCFPAFLLLTLFKGKKRKSEFL